MTDIDADTLARLRERLANDYRDAAAEGVRYEAAYDDVATLLAALEAAEDRIDALREQVGVVTRERDEWESNAEDAEDERDALRGERDRAESAVDFFRAKRIEADQARDRAEAEVKRLGRNAHVGSVSANVAYQKQVVAEDRATRAEGALTRVRALADNAQVQYEASDYSEQVSMGHVVQAIRAALDGEGDDA